MKKELCAYCHNTLVHIDCCNKSGSHHRNHNASVTTSYDEWREELTDKVFDEFNMVYLEHFKGHDLFMVHPVIIHNGRVKTDISFLAANFDSLMLFIRNNDIIPYMCHEVDHKFSLRFCYKKGEE